ncbi:acyl-CoA thioesterase II [Cryptococcus gattii VGV]|nr:acyl-CoA thioesterase II [Cryptococcus gattii VGV]
MSLASRISVSPHPNKPFTFIPHHVWVPPGARSVYGGLVISQALCSSLLTVGPSFGLHSFHCYFIHPGLPDRGIEYRVDKLAEGKRYTRREVRGWQNGRMFFILLASYESPQGTSSVPSQDRTNVKVSHSLTAMAQPWDEDPTQKNGEDFEVKESFQMPFPKELRPWDQCEDNEDFLQRLLQEKSKEELGWKWELFDSWLKNRDSAPFSSSVARKIPGLPSSKEYYVNGLPTTRMVWYRPRINPDETISEEMYKSMVAYLTDYQLVGTATRSIGLDMSSTPQLGLIASLDHSIHFYRLPSNLNYREPILHVMESQVADMLSGRAVARGRVYSTKGKLLAVTCQEGVFRIREPGKKPMGVAASGIDEEDLQARL